MICIMSDWNACQRLIGVLTDDVGTTRRHPDPIGGGVVELHEALPHPFGM